MTTITERPYLYSFSANEIRYVFNVSDPASPGCAVEIELYYHAVGVAGTLLTTLTPLTPNTDGSIYCDVKSYLKSILKYQLPVVGGNSVEPVTDQLKYFYIRFREITEAAPNPAWTDDIANERIVLLGGVEQAKFKRNNFFVSYLQNNKIFLTWQPSNRFVFINQSHYLTVLLRTVSASLVVHVDTFFTDGTTNSSTITYNLNGSNDILFRIRTGATDLGLPAINPGKKIHYYEIKVLDANAAVVANAYRFYVDYRPVTNFWDFQYFNSLGGLDSARIKGSVDWTVIPSFDQVVHIPYKDLYNSDRPQEQFSFANVVKTDNFKGDAGWSRTKLEQEAMVEMFLHPIFEIIDSRWIRIMNMQKTHDLRNSDDKKWSFPVEWTYGYEDPVFTPKEIKLGPGQPDIVIVGPTCSPVTLPGSASLPNGVVGTPYSYDIVLGGDAPFVFSTLAKPSWMTISITGNTLSFTGIPNATGSDVQVRVFISNCDANNNVTLVDGIDVTANAGGGGGGGTPAQYSLAITNLTGSPLQVQRVDNQMVTIQNGVASLVAIGQTLTLASNSSIGSGLHLDFFAGSTFLSNLYVDVALSGGNSWAYATVPTITRIEVTLVQ